MSCSYTTLYTPCTSQIEVDGTLHIVYGILGQAIPQMEDSPPQLIPDITTEFGELATLILEMTREQIELCHMADVVEDFLAVH